MWIVKNIMEADFGCEERSDNKPLMENYYSAVEEMDE